MARLAQALVAGSYEGTLLAEKRLSSVARAYRQHAEVVVLPESAVVSIGGKTHVVTGVPAIPELSRVSALNVWEAEASRPLGKHGRSVAARELRRATTHGPAQ